MNTPQEALSSGSHADYWTCVEAIESGDTAAIEALLTAGTNPDLSVGAGSLVEVAVAAGNPEVVKLLARFGADIESPDSEGRTLLSQAASATDGSDGFVALLAAGADPDAQDRDGWTPLHFAAAHGYRANAEALLAHGADVETLTATGLTAAAVAERNQHTGLAMRLSVDQSASD